MESNLGSGFNTGVVVANDSVGSIEKGISGDYDFSIRQIISEAWEKTSGSKGTIWLAILFYVLAFVGIMIVANLIVGLLGFTVTPGDMKSTIIAMSITQLLIIVVVMPMAVGLWMIGIKRAVCVPAKATEIFQHFGKILTLLGTAALIFLMIMIFFALCVIVPGIALKVTYSSFMPVLIGLIIFMVPAIYLSVAYTFAMPLVIEKGLSPWQAMETSRKAVHHHWFRFLGLGLAMMVIYLISAIPFGIGIIWTLPMMMLATGIAYRNIFGYDGLDAVSA